MYKWHVISLISHTNRLTRWIIQKKIFCALPGVRSLLCLLILAASPLYFMKQIDTSRNDRLVTATAFIVSKEMNFYIYCRQTSWFNGSYRPISYGYMIVILCRKSEEFPKFPLQYRPQFYLLSWLPSVSYVHCQYLTTVP